MNKNEGSSSVVSPFGGLPQYQARQFQKRYADPMSRSFGFGPNGFGREMTPQFKETLGQTIPQASAVGSNIAAKAPAAYENLVQAIQQGQAGGADALTAARNYLQQVSGPSGGDVGYQVAADRAREGARRGAADRGTLGMGGQAPGEEQAVRDVAMQFANAREGRLNTGIQNVVGASQVNPQLAGMGMQGLDQYSQLLQQGYRLPAEAVDQVMNFIGGTASPQLAFLQGIAPQIGQNQKGFGIL